MLLKNLIKEELFYSNKNLKIKDLSTDSRKIKKGDLFTEDNVTTKRPALGISPMKWKEILGTKASKDYHLDDLIE